MPDSTFHEAEINPALRMWKWLGPIPGSFIEARYAITGLDDDLDIDREAELRAMAGGLLRGMTSVYGDDAAYVASRHLYGWLGRHRIVLWFVPLDMTVRVSTIH